MTRNRIQLRFYLNNEKIMPSIKVIGVILFTSAILTLDPRFLISPPLHSDDWTLVADVITRGSKFFDLSNRRPLLNLPYFLFYYPFGLRIAYWYVVHFLVVSAIGVLLKFLLDNAFPTFRKYTLPITILALVYPLDFTKPWLIHIHAHFVFVLALLSIYLLFSYIKTGKLLPIILANLLFIISLLIYEAGFGLVMMASVVLLLASIKSDRKWSIGLISVLLTGVLFVFWRIIVQPRIFPVEDNYLNQLTFSPITFITRFGKTTFLAIYSWIGPLILKFGQAKYFIFLIIVLVCVLFFVFLVVRFLRKVKSTNGTDNKTQSLQPLFGMFIIGILFWASGYIPTILYSSPGIVGDDTRFSLFSTPGAALTLAAALLIISQITSIHTKKANIVLIFFITMALLLQIRSNNQRISAWNTQKEFWNSVLRELPNLKDETNLFAIVDSSVTRQYDFSPFWGNWEVRSALRILYNNFTLNAAYLFIDSTNPNANLLTGFSNYTTNIYLIYDNNSHTGKIVKDPAIYYETQHFIDGYNPFNLITPKQEKTESYQWLIQ